MRGTDRENEYQSYWQSPAEHHKKDALGIAPANAELIERSRLVQRLTGTGSAPIVLISALAGYGKSTLLTQWAAHERASGVRFASVELGPRDNDPNCLWVSIAYALHAVCPGLAKLDRVPLPIRAAPRDLPTAALPSLVGRIWAHCPRLILAFDNYAHITNPVCHEHMASLLNHLPPQARLVLATQHDPPLPLARLRACGALVELGMAELGFSQAEIAHILWRVGGCQVSDGDVRSFAERTEGWPAVVHLAARLLRDRPDPVAFLRSFGGGNRYVLDYVREEVVRDLPDHTRDVLATTSMLRRFTARLCDAVTGTPNSANLLDELERSNLLLVPLGGDHTSYRHHRLIGTALAEQLGRADPDRVTALHRRASIWYQQHGEPTGAIDHAVAAGETEQAAGLVERHWARYVYRGEQATVGDWLAVLGEDAISRRSATTICAAWLATLAGDHLAGDRWLTIAERLGHTERLPDGMQGVRGAVALYRGAFGFGGVSDMSVAARTATDLHRDPASPWYAQARVALGYSHYLTGDLRAAVRPLELAAQASVAFPVLRVTALSVLSLVTCDLGRTDQAADLATAARNLVAAANLHESSQVLLARVAHAGALVRTGQAHRARAELEQVARTSRTSVGLPPWPTVVTLLSLARVALALGDPGAARAHLDEASDLLQLVPNGADQMRARVLEVRRRLAGGAPSSAITVTARLTDREEAVLRLLPSSLPLREVAAQLFVTVNTVKSHTRLIYRKLGASSRTEAIRRARELGLL